MELTRHLISDHGLRRLAFVGSAEESPDVAARFRGYLAACRAEGLQMGDEPDLRVGMMTQAEGARVVNALFTRDDERPEALVFANDQMAVGALHALQERGLRVPDDVAVTGFDGIPLSRLVRPALTTVRQPMVRMGEEAVELLVKRLSGARDTEPASLMLPVTVVHRGSCGCGNAEDTPPASR